MFVAPRHPIHFPNIFPSNILYYYIIYSFYAPSMIYSIYLWAVYLKTIIYVYLAFTIFAYPLIKRELRLSSRFIRIKRPFRCAANFSKDPRNVALTYRCLQLIMTGSSLQFGHYLPIVQALFTQLAISTAYILILNGNTMKLFTKLAFLVTVPFCMGIWVAMLSCAGAAYKLSKKCVTDWKVEAGLISTQVERKYMTKFSRSCKPLKFECPGFMTATYDTVLSFMQGISRGVFRILLALQ